MEDTILYLHSLAIAVLIGKVVLLSFVVAPVLAKQLDREPFGKVVRELFPAYYALGMGAAAIGVLSLLMLGIINETNVIRHLAAGVWLVVLAAETYCRSPLTPRRQCDAGSAQRAGITGTCRSRSAGRVESITSTIGLSELARAAGRTVFTRTGRSMVIHKEE